MSMTAEQIENEWDEQAAASGPDESEVDPFNINRKFKFNFTGIKDEFELMPEGTYSCIVEDIDIQPAKEPKPGEDKKYDQVVFTFKITAGEYKGRTIKEWRSQSPKALVFLLKIFKGLGFENAEDAEFEFERGEIVGIPCFVSLQHVPTNVKDARTGKWKMKQSVQEVWKDDAATLDALDAVDMI